MLLKLSAPLFMPLVALIWLGEGLSLRIAGAVALGFVGVAVILEPGSATWHWQPVVLIALLGGFFAAIAKVTVRRLGRSEPARRTVFYFGLIATCVSSLPLLWRWQTPAPEAWPWLLAVGGFATAGQLCLSRGFALAPAGRLAPFTYFSIVFGALIGWLFWGETLGWSTALGTLLVVAAGLYSARPGTPPPRAVVSLEAR